jgi:hypothetical protein
MHERIRERPILFSAPMVKALLAGTKTQTRRVVKGLALEWLDEFTPEFVADAANHLCPYGVPGDRLWVRETLRKHGHFGFPLGECPQEREHQGRIWSYAADEVPGHTGSVPSIHTPRWASRITLEVTEVRVQRLQDISEEDCVAEGAPGGNGAIPNYHYAATPAEHYRHVWEGINGPGSWDANPYVWAVSFRKVAP